MVGVFTNPDGSFVMRGLPPGAYKLMVQPLMLGSVPSPNAAAVDTINIQRRMGIPFTMKRRGTVTGLIDVRGPCRVAGLSGGG